MSISKSYQRLKGKDVITTPKTKKSNRVIKMPKFSLWRDGGLLKDVLQRRGG